MRTVPLIALLVALIATKASAQTISEETGNVNPFSRSIRLAAEDGPTWFPKVTAASPEGALIIASGDFQNSDVTIVVENSRLNELKPRIRALVNDLGRPQTYIRVRRGRKVGSFDLEFNPYIIQKGNTSSSEIPLGTIVQALKPDLPQPLGVVIVTRTSKATFRGTPIDKVELLSPTEIGSYDVVQFTAERHWYGLVAISFLGLLILSACGIVLKTAFKTKSPDTVSLPASPQSLTEAQARYDSLQKKKPFQILQILPLLMIIAIPVSRPALQDGFMWVPDGVLKWLIWPLVLIPGFTVIKVYKARKKAKPAAAPPPTSLRYAKYFLIPFVFLLAVMQIKIMAPQWLYWIPPAIFRWLILTLAFAPILIAVIAFLIGSKKTRTRLQPGDVDYDGAVELANKANVKVRRVFVLNEIARVNAFASLFGTIGLTQGARDKLTDGERRCVIAHEIGHHKGRHVPLLILFGFVVMGVMIAVSTWFQASAPVSVRFLSAVLDSPVVFLLVVTLARAPLQRKAEFAADTFALESIGSFEEVATALAKVHLYNASPHTLTKFHESISSHPSLIRRLTALRDVATKMGISTPDDAVQKIIDSTILVSAPPVDAAGLAPTGA